MLNINKLDLKMEEWVETRPDHIRELISKYPPGHYLVKSFAPYAITAPGCEVELIGYKDDEVIVIVLKSTPASDLHCLELSKKFGRGPTSAIGLEAKMSPEWLELLEVSDTFREAFSLESEKPSD